MAIESPIQEIKMASVRKILMDFACSEDMLDLAKGQESADYIASRVANNIDIVWGVTTDNNLLDMVRVIVIAV